MKKYILALMILTFVFISPININANSDDNYYSSQELGVQLDYIGSNSSHNTTWERSQGNTGVISTGWYNDGTDRLKLNYHGTQQDHADLTMPAGRYEMSTHNGARYQYIEIFGIRIDIDIEMVTFDIGYYGNSGFYIEWVYQSQQEYYLPAPATIEVYDIDMTKAHIILYDNNVAGNESLDSAYNRGVDAGYNDGYNDGDTQGYLRGHTAGMQQNAGIDNLTSNFTTGLTDILSLEIGGLSLGALALIPISIAVFSWFLKLFGKG